MKTYQDLEKVRDNDRDLCAFLLALKNDHEGSEMVRTARDADLYDRQKNPGIDRFYKEYAAAMRKAEVFQTESKRPDAQKCNLFRRLTTQRTVYLTGNGVAFDDEAQKEKLGVKFDNAVKKATKLAIIHGLCFGFWNRDKLEIFPLTEAAPLWDEENGHLRAVMRYWRLDDEKPLHVTLYTETGYRNFRTENNRGSQLFPVEQNEKPYLYSTTTTAAGGTEVTDVGGYSSLPIVPLWGSELKQSALVGLERGIDAFDIIASGFVSTVEEAAEVFWLVENYGGMTRDDLKEWLTRARTDHIITADTSSGGKITPYTQPVPVDARQASLAHLKAQLYEDFGGLDVHTVSADSTNDHLEAAYQPMDEEVDDLEYQLIEWILQIEKVAGLPESVPTFKRDKVSNVKEQVEIVLLEAEYLDDDTILDKLPNITPDEKEKILAARQAERAAMMELPEVE